MSLRRGVVQSPVQRGEEVEFVINLGFSGSCKGLGAGGGWLARLHNGRAQDYLRVLGLALVVLVLMLIWGGGK